MFPCPECGERTHIKKPGFADGGLWRTRICNVCPHAFQTIEVSDEAFKARVHQRVQEILATIRELRTLFIRNR
jgi:hypothetical protein